MNSVEEWSTLLFQQSIVRRIFMIVFGIGLFILGAYLLFLRHSPGDWPTQGIVALSGLTILVAALPGGNVIRLETNHFSYRFMWVERKFELSRIQNIGSSEIYDADGGKIRAIVFDYNDDDGRIKKVSLPARLSAKRNQEFLAELNRRCPKAEG